MEEFTTIKVTKEEKKRMDLVKAKYTLKMGKKVSSSELFNALLDTFEKNIR